MFDLRFSLLPVPQGNSTFLHLVQSLTAQCAHVCPEHPRGTYQTVEPTNVIFLEVKST